MPARRTGPFRQPLFRLLAINLAIGTAVAVLTLGGLLVLNPQDLRGLIAADRSPGVAIGLLLFGLLITFGSVAMGTAIMLIGRDDTSAARGNFYRWPPEPSRRARSCPRLTRSRSAGFRAGV